MRAQATPPTPPTTSVATCEACGTPLLRRTGRRFCSRTCYLPWWREHILPTASKAGANRLAQLRAEGRDPRIRRNRPRHPAMIESASEGDELDDDLWASRGVHWQAADDQTAKPSQRSTRRHPPPLVLTGHGVRLRIQDGALLVRDGYTHHPQHRREHRVFPGRWRVPSRIILINTDGYLTIDVITWLAHHHLPLILLDWRGGLISIIGPDQAAADPDLRAAQLEALTNGVGLGLAHHLITHKLAASIDTLNRLPTSTAISDGINRIDTLCGQLRQQPPDTIDDVRLVEAWAAHAYFTALHTIPLHWKNTRRHAIPPDWHHIATRHSPYGATNRHATHPVAAIQNFAYTILETHIRITAVTAGLDPTIGYLHANRAGRASLVYDLMEPLRPRTDAAILRFLLTHTFATGDIHLTRTGVCRLHPQLARHITTLTTPDPVEIDAVIGNARNTLAGSLG